MTKKYAKYLPASDNIQINNFPFYWIRAKYFYSICHLGTNVYSFTQILYRCARHKDKAGSRQGLQLPAARILPFRFLTPYKNESKVIAHLLA